MPNRLSFTNSIKQKNRKWQTLKITRILLNPEQAVLSCCKTLTRGPTHTFSASWIAQCLGTYGCGSFGDEEYTSS